MHMTRYGITTAVATGFAGLLIGLAAPAQADLDHHDWVREMQQQAPTGTVAAAFGNGR